MSSEQDVVPTTAFGAPPPKHVEISIVGNDAVRMLEEIVSNLVGVNDHKGAVLRMIGVFHAAIGKSVLVQEGDSEPLVVQGLWRP